MKRFVALTLTITALALTSAGAASAITPRQLATQTAYVFNERFSFIDSPYLITGVHCMQEAPNYFYCRGKAIDYGRRYPAIQFFWNVHIDNAGIIHWAKA